jgi:hypothetical protein
MRDVYSRRRVAGGDFAQGRFCAVVKRRRRDSAVSLEFLMINIRIQRRETGKAGSSRLVESRRCVNSPGIKFSFATFAKSSSHRAPVVRNANDDSKRNSKELQPKIDDAP